MKNLVILLLIGFMCTTCSGQGFIPNEEIVEECRLELELVSNSTESPNLPSLVGPPSEIPACLLACVLQKVNVMDESGEINVDAGMEKAVERFDGYVGNLIAGAINLCADKAGQFLPDVCKVASRYSKCFVKNVIGGIVRKLVEVQENPDNLLIK